MCMHTATGICFVIILNNFNLATEMGAKLEDTMGPVSADSLAQQCQDTGTYWRIWDETPQ